METLGNTSLAAALLASGAAGWAALASRKRRLPTPSHKPSDRATEALEDTAVALLGVAAAMALVSLGALLTSYLLNDFQVVSIQRSSSRFTPLPYKLSALWVNLQTSLHFWAVLQTACAYLGALWVRRRQRLLLGWTVFFLATLSVFFTALVVLRHNVWDTFLLEKPLFGGGLTPLLRNPWMAVHPPAQYLGYVSTALPFALTLAALVEAMGGSPGESPERGAYTRWRRALRAPLLFSWVFLFLGMVLGMVWAYEEADWGGYWSWDPVENASLMPLLTATAALHCLGQKGRGFRWAAILGVMVTFFLTLFGTFLTRTGVLESVHTFGKDRFLTYAFLGLLVGGLLLSVTLTVKGAQGLTLFPQPPTPSPGPTPPPGPTPSRLAQMGRWSLGLGVAILILGALYVTMAASLGVLWPLLGGHRLALTREVFEGPMRPLGLILGAAMAVGLSALGPSPRSDSAWASHRRWLLRLAPLLFGLGGAAAAAWIPSLGVRGPWGVVGVGVSLAALSASLLLPTRRLRGRYVLAALHAGVALTFLGFSARSGLKHRTATLQAGESVEVAGVRYTFAGTSHKPTLLADHFSTPIHLQSVDSGPGESMGTLTPKLVAFLHTPQSPMSRTAHRRRVSKEIQIRLRGARTGGNQDRNRGRKTKRPRQSGDQARLEVVMHPFGAAIWAGFTLAILAGLVLLGAALSKRPRNDRSADESSPIPSRAWRCRATIVGLAVWVGAVWGVMRWGLGYPGLSSESLGVALAAVPLGLAVVAILSLGRAVGSALKPQRGGAP